MNQAIQFPDREEWNDAQQAVYFPALVNGLQLTCIMRAEVLAERFGGDSPALWLALFRENRWDLEDEAEQLIREQQEDEQGYIWLS
ncbi:Protein of unknown function [Enterobacter sp. NFR05]|nr:Protein of unknown function [Enterobacter sp. NFR05]